MLGENRNLVGASGSYKISRSLLLYYYCCCSDKLIIIVRRFNYRTTNASLKAIASVE